MNQWRYTMSETRTPINRPTTFIIETFNGNHTYVVTSDTWTMEYTRRTSEPLDVAKSKAKEFLKVFDTLAKRIDDGLDRPYNIMAAMMDQGLFNRSRKLELDTSKF